MLTFFEKPSISLTFFRIFESIQLIQSYEPLKVNRLIHLLYENELTQSLINLFGKGTKSIQPILRENEPIQINQLSRVDWYTSLGSRQQAMRNQVSHDRREGVQQSRGFDQPGAKSSEEAKWQE